MYEVEVKSKLKDREAIAEKLKIFGCVFSEELHQVDHIFIPEDQPFPPPFEVPVLRIRKQNDKYIFTLKISQSSRQDCIERELEIQDGEKMIEIMYLMKYKKAPVVDKRRIKTVYKDMEIVLDIVEGLGEFIEVEKIVQEQDPEARVKIQDELLSFLEELGVPKEDHVIGGKYDIMLEEKYGLINHK